MPFLVYSASRPKFSDFLNGANFKRIPSAQVTNFGHFNSNFVQNWVVFVKKASLRYLKQGLFKLKARNDFSSQFLSR